MSNLEVHQVPALTDNYVHLLLDKETGACAAVDPGQAAPVLAALDRLGWTLTHVLCTHHHGDHVGGNAEIKKATGATIVAARVDLERICAVDLPVSEGDQIAIGAQTARVLEVPGHTTGHVAYLFEDAQSLFSGDTLFSLGCGRLFGGTPDQMWESLCRLRALPGDTLVYPGHEYTESNASFALSQDSDNQALQDRADAVRALRQAGLSSLPSTIAQECAANPFLRADDPSLLAAAGLTGLDPLSAFTELRRRKDNF